jgi:hypothetical protein
MRRSALIPVSGISGALLLLGAYVGPATSATDTAASQIREAADSVAVGVFEGRTPCGPIANAFTGFPAANCEKIKWEITLFRDRATGAAKSYVYRGTRTARHGRWSVRRGAAHDPNAVVYQLHYGSDRVLSLLSIDDKVLLLLDPSLRVLVGDASWSYTLNRGDPR